MHQLILFIFRMRCTMSWWSEDVLSISRLILAQTSQGDTLELTMKFTFGPDCNGDAIVFTALLITCSLLLRQSHVTRLQKKSLCFLCGSTHVYYQGNLQCSLDPYLPPRIELSTCPRVLGLHEAVCALEWSTALTTSTGEWAGILLTMCPQVMLTYSRSCVIDCR